MLFFLSLVVEGALAGMVYALIALAFVVVYRSARTINFALGEWIQLATLMVAVGASTMQLGAASAIALACAGMVALAFTFNRLVLDRLAGRPAITFLMATLGLGMLMRGMIAVVFEDIPRALPFALPRAPVAFLGLEVSAAKLTSGVIAALLIGSLALFLARSRTGLAWPGERWQTTRRPRWPRASTLAVTAV